METTYKGVTITYNENKERFDFTLRGVDRFASSLKLAKEAIDKPAPAGKKTLQRFDVFAPRSWGSLSELERATVTSISGKSYRGVEVWIVFPKKPGENRGERRQIAIESCFAVSPENEKKLAEVAEIDKEMEVLDRKRKVIFNEGLEKAKLPANVETE